MKKKKIYIIAMLCNDNGRYYIDYIYENFDSKINALNEMKLYAQEKFRNLKETGGRYEYASVDDEITISEKEELIIRYSIVEV